MVTLYIKQNTCAILQNSNTLPNNVPMNLTSSGKNMLEEKLNHSFLGHILRILLSQGIEKIDAIRQPYPMPGAFQPY